MIKQDLVGECFLSKLLMLTMFLLGAGFSSADESGRENFGRSGFGIWSPLSDFEIQTLNSRNLAINGDADALLAFYLLASGDVREQNLYLDIQQQLNRWTIKSTREISEGEDAEARAELLHLAMHRDFFKGGEKRKANVDGYDLDQSQLSKIFTDKTYNCISSSLLYIVLARKFGFDPQGVLLPSHAFVQLNFRNGQEVEIETTSRNGYNILHDEKFYQQDEQWFTDRSLTPTTFADYQQRRIISPYQLGLENMWSQHIGPERMDYLNRMRMAEIRGYLAPDDRTAQLNRLTFYNEEFNRFVSSDTDALSRMFTTVEQNIYGLDDAPFRDPEFNSLLTWVSFEMAYVFAATDRQTEGLALARSLLQSVDERTQNHKKLTDNLYQILIRHTQEKVKVQAFAEARDAYEGVEDLCLADENCAKSYAHVYAKWGEFFWQQRQWSSVVDVIGEYLIIAADTEPATTMHKNLESAYLNWAKDYIQESEIDAAKKVLETCIASSREQKNCTEVLAMVIEQDERGLL